MKKSCYVCAVPNTGRCDKIDRHFREEIYKYPHQLPVSADADYFMLKRLDRRIFNYIINKPMMRKAVAFSVYVKTLNATGVFKDWTWRELARVAGCSVTTAQKRVAMLRRLGLARFEYHNGHRYLVFKALHRGKIKNYKNNLYHTPINADVDLSRIDVASVRTIEKALMALEIVEVQRRKEYAQRSIMLHTNTPKGTRKSQITRARKVCRARGWESYSDGGFSYKGISKRLHCSPNTVKEVIATGEGLEMFEAHRAGLVLVKYIGGNGAKFALPFFKEEFPTAFATRNNIYVQPPLVFTLAY